MKSMRFHSLSLITCLLAFVLAPVSFAGNAQTGSKSVMTYEITGRAQVPNRSCTEGFRSFLDVDTGMPGPKWPTQVVVKGSGPWQITLRAPNGMLDMGTTAVARVYCVLKHKTRR